MLIPYNTDAPLYHPPIATISCIGVNIAATVLVWYGFFHAEETTEFWVEQMMLQYGAGLRPWQWISSAFLQIDPFHLISNIACLWGFGLVVEGKIGWWRFLLIYLGIAMVQGGFEQTLMLFADGGASLGASSVVYGLLVICLLWAPENEMSCLIIFFRVFTFDVKISALAIFALLLEAATAMFAGLTLSSQILHLMGAAVGFGIGLVMLRKNWVDCEGWDFFSVWSGRETEAQDQFADEAAQLVAQAERSQIRQPDPQSAAAPLKLQFDDTPPRQGDDASSGQGSIPLTPVALTPVEQNEPPLNVDVEGPAPERPATAPQPALDAVRAKLAESDGEGAFALYRRLPPETAKSAERELVSAIQLMQKHRQWNASVPALVAYLFRFQTHATRLRLRLARILIDVEQRPRQALRVLDKLDPHSLSEPERDKLARLRRKAERQLPASPTEAPVMDW